MVFEICEEPRVLTLDTCFIHTLLQEAASGKLFVERKIADDDVITMSFEKAQAFHAVCRLGVLGGESAACLELDVALFALPRSSARVFISLLSVIRGLQLSGEMTPGVWLCKRMARLRQQMDRLELKDTVLPAQQYDRHRLQRGEDVARVLPFPSASTHAMLAMLIRWGGGPFQGSMVV